MEDNVNEVEWSVLIVLALIIVYVLLLFLFWNEPLPEGLGDVVVGNFTKGVI
jgi:hypothetical protein